MIAFFLFVALCQEPKSLFPKEVVSFDPVGEVVFEAEPGKWDARIRERGWILFENNEYRMWYTGYAGAREDSKMLGLATSSDGKVWRRHQANPIYSSLWVEDMMIIKHADRYIMFSEGRNDIAQQMESLDGVTWNRIESIDIRKEDGTPLSKGPYGTPTVWFENDTWHLFYERSDLGIWLAKSKDRKIWTNVSDNPVLSPGPEPFDRHKIAMNQIIKRDGRYFAVYHGLSDPEKKTWRTCVATSADLVHWTKFTGNPIVHGNVSSGIFVDTPSGLVLYTMHDVVRRHAPSR